MSFLHQLAKGSGLLFASAAATKLLTLFTLPILTVLLLPAAYGEASLVAVLSALTAVIALAGLDVSYARAHFGSSGLNSEQVESLIWYHGFRNAAIAGVLSALFWLYMSRKIQGLHSEMAIAVLLTVSGSVFSALAQTRARLHNHYRRLAAGILAASVLAYAVILPMAFQSQLSVYALVSGGVILAWVPFLSQAQPNWRLIRQARHVLDAGIARGILRVGLPAIITAPAFMFVSSADRWFLGLWQDSATVGVYAIAVSFGTLGMMVNSAVHAAWVPEVVRIHEMPDAQHTAEIAQGKRLVISLYAVTWAGITTFSPELVRWLTAPVYHQAIEVVPVIAAGVFFYGCAHVFNTVFLINRRMDVTAKIWLAAVLCHFFLNIWLIPWQGMLGAAMAQAMAFVLVTVLLFWFGRNALIAMKITPAFIAQLLILMASALFLYQWNSADWLYSLLLKIAVLAPLTVGFLWLNLPTNAVGKRWL